MKEALIGFLGALLGGGCTILGTYISYKLNKKEKDELIKKRNEFNISSFQEILTNNILPSIEENITKRKEITEKLQKNDKIFPYTFSDTEFLKLPLEALFDEALFKEILLEKEISSESLHKFLSFIKIIDNFSLSSILSTYNKLLFDITTRHNTIYHNMYIVLKPEDREKEIKDLDKKTDESIGYLNTVTTNELNNSIETIEEFKKIVNEIKSKLD